MATFSMSRSSSRIAALASKRTFTTSPCTGALARIAGGRESEWYVPEKEESAIKVVLLRSLPKYGERGDIIAVDRSHMRNNLYPKGKADYIVKGRNGEIVWPELSQASSSAHDDVYSLPKLVQQPTSGYVPKGESELPRLQQLKKATFKRALIAHPPSPSASSTAEQQQQAIHGSVTLKTISDVYNAPAHVTFTWPSELDQPGLVTSGAGTARVKSTGTYVVRAKDQYGDELDLEFAVVGLGEHETVEDDLVLEIRDEFLSEQQ